MGKIKVKHWAHVVLNRDKGKAVEMPKRYTKKEIRAAKAKAKP